MTNADKAKAILGAIQAHIDQAAKDYSDHYGFEQSVKRNIIELEKSIEKSDVVGGWDRDSSRLDALKEKAKNAEERCTSSYRLLEDWRQVYEYALEQFLNKIP